MPPIASPKLFLRFKEYKVGIKIGQTISEKRERLETASERAAAKKKAARKKHFRIIITVITFLVLGLILLSLYFLFSEKREKEPEKTVYIPYSPTIEIIDEDSGATGGKITSRMSEYIGQAESDFRELGYTPLKAVLPSGSVREVDFYLEGYSGFIKMLIDRETAVSVEDADRLIRYLAEKGITDFSYLDVRLSGKAYWK